MRRILAAAWFLASLCSGQDVLVVVNGERIASEQQIDLALMREIARIHSLEPTPSEMAALKKKWNAAVAKAPPRQQAPDLDEDGWYRLMLKQGMPESEARQRAKDQLAAMVAFRKKLDDGWIEAVALGYKVNRYLFSKHGGRVVLSAFGFHMATDGFAAEVAALERSGAVAWQRASARESFYQRTLTYGGDGVTKGDRAREVFARPPWE